ncbi:MAG: hypothetical protein DRP92_01390 [Candidatus Neomarinimicrobiota bacterium]|nr:MAG: hypothetical protein DRP92_01390 [Candidatus Neomarinimicrobiota bacterium]
MEEDLITTLIKLDPVEPISNLMNGISGAMNRTGILPLQTVASLLEAIIFQEKVFRRLIRAAILFDRINQKT